MKILFKIISAFLYFNFVSPVQMYYIYDETPNVGFVSADNGIGTYVNTGFSMGKASKKQFMASYSKPKFQKVNNEHVVDAHFKVRKSPSKPHTIPAVADTGMLITYETNEGKNKARRVEEYRNTEAPQQLQHNPQHQQMVNTAGQQDNQNKQGDYDAKSKEAVSHMHSSNNQQIPTIRSKAVNADYSNSIWLQNQDVGKCNKNQRAESDQRNHGAERGQRNQDLGHNQRNLDLGRNQRNLDLGRGQRQNVAGRGRRQNVAGRGRRQNDTGRSQINQDGGYDSKPTFMYVRKASMSVEPQAVLNGNHQMTSLSVISPDKRQRMPTSMIVDKTLQKESGIANDQQQVMAGVLHDIAKKITNRRHAKGEYVSRNIEDHLDSIYEKSKRSVIAENLRKYIGKEKRGKDLRKHHKQITPLARIGSHEESLEDNTLYAVFYRMNPESLDRQDAFMITRSVDDNGNSDFGSKEKFLRSAFREDTRSRAAIQQSKRNGGNTLQRKKLRNFSSHMNY